MVAPQAGAALPSGTPTLMLGRVVTWFHSAHNKPRRLDLHAAILCLVPVLALCAGTPRRAASLAERLGYKATDRLLIVNGDDVGMSHSANVATIDSLERGLMTSATIMVPCPWFTEIARYAKARPEKDFGIHLVHTSEWQVYRWGPVSSKSDVPGLVDPEGYLWRRVEDVYAHATPEQALVEARAQVKMALAAGVDVTHLDSHMGAMQYDPRYHAAYLQLAKELNLPVRMGSQTTYDRLGAPHLRRTAAEMGLVFPDYLIHEENPEPGESRKRFWLRILRSLKPGVTELYIHAALPTEEMKAIAGSWQERGVDYELFTRDPDIRKAMEEEGVIRIGWRSLRDLQRKGARQGRSDGAGGGGLQPGSAGGRVPVHPGSAGAGGDGLASD